MGIRRRTTGSLPFDSIKAFQVHAIISSSDRAICDGSVFLYRRNEPKFIIKLDNTLNIIGWFGICLSSTTTLPDSKASAAEELSVGALI